MAGILIAERDKTLAHLLELSLRREGHWVVWAYDGAQALFYVREADFDLCVVGEGLFDMAAESLLGALRRVCDPLPRVLIVGAEGASDGRDHWAARGAGAYVGRPARLPLLIQRIERLLGRPPADRAA